MATQGTPAHLVRCAAPDAIQLTRRPQASNLRVSGKLGPEFDDAADEAELVPALDHPRLDELLVGVEDLLLLVERLV
jgi:hypothetical protein